MMAKLYKVKIIRDFLTLYKKDCWEKLICNMVEYGIILLKKKKNVSSMSLDDINNFVEDLKRTEGLLSPTNNYYNNKRNSNSKNRKFSSKKNISNSSFNKSITSNYSSKSSKSLNKKRDYSVKSKSKQKSGFLKRNESFSYNKNIKKNKKINKSFSGSENKNNYTRIKIDSNRELTANNYNFNKNENFGGQLALKDSFNSLSSKDAFFTNKKINNNTFNFASNKKSSKKSFQFNNDNLKKNNNSNNNDIYNKTENKNKNSNNKNNSKTNNKKKKKGNNNAGSKTRTIKIESKIKDLIQKDKNNFINSGGISNNNFNDINNNNIYGLPMSAIDELGSLRSNNDIPTKTSNDSLRINIGNKNNNNNNININNNDFNNNILNNNNINNNNDFNNYNLNNNNNDNNISAITSLEDKLNGLTLKLSKLNESINNNKKTLSSYSNLDKFSMYSKIDIKNENNENDNNSPFTNIGLGNTALNKLNDENNINNNVEDIKHKKIHSGLNYYLGLKNIDYNNSNFEENKILINNNLNNENDEDYLGEEQINI